MITSWQVLDPRIRRSWSFLIILLALTMPDSHGCFISNCPVSGKKRSVVEEQLVPYQAREEALACPSDPAGLCYSPGLCCVQGRADGRLGDELLCSQVAAMLIRDACLRWRRTERIRLAQG